MHKNKILLVGGGTGGHIGPIFAVYKKLKLEKANVVVIGGGTDVEKKFFNENDDFHTLSTGKLHRAINLRNIFEALLLIFGLIQSLYYLIKFRPKLIFSKGSYVSLPVILWAKLLKIPYFIHESDIIMGATNKFASSQAEKVFVGFPEKYYSEIQKEKLSFSGQIIDLHQEKSEVFDFGFDGKKPVILITGGSQGSLPINKVVFESLPYLLPKYNLIHQTGSLGYERAMVVRNAVPEDHKKSYFVRDFLDVSGEINFMASAITVSDLVVGRAGATTIGEIAAAGKPMILIPYKYAAADHQQKNAEVLSQSDAAIIIEDDKLTPLSLAEKIEKLFENKEKMKEIGRHAKDFFPSNGLDKVCGEIVSFVNTKERQ